MIKVGADSFFNQLFNDWAHPSSFKVDRLWLTGLSSTVSFQCTTGWKRTAVWVKAIDGLHRPGNVTLPEDRITFFLFFLTCHFFLPSCESSKARGVIDHQRAVGHYCCMSVKLLVPCCFRDCITKHVLEHWVIDWAIRDNLHIGAALRNVNITRICFAYNEDLIVINPNLLQDVLWNFWHHCGTEYMAVEELTLFSESVLFHSLICWTFPPIEWRKPRPRFSGLDQRTGVSIESPFLESSHHSTVIETEGPFIWLLLWEEGRALGVGWGSSMETKKYLNGWTESYPECIIYRVAVSGSCLMGATAPLWRSLVGRIGPRDLSSLSKPCLRDNVVLCGKLWGERRNFPSAPHIEINKNICDFSLGYFWTFQFTWTNTHLQIPTVHNISFEKKPYLRRQWKCSERFGVGAQRKPCACMFTALSLAEVRPSPPDKCKASLCLAHLSYQC